MLQMGPHGPNTGPERCHRPNGPPPSPSRHAQDSAAQLRKVADGLLSGGRPSNPETDAVASTETLERGSQIEPSLEGTDYTTYHRRREWNRGPLQDFFPRIPAPALETLLDICIYRKDFTYNLSESRHWNARRYTSIAVAHIRHAYTDYDRLLREGKVERYAARRETADKVWKVLREWCPWDESNECLDACWRVTLLRPEEREPGWDPMDVDGDSDFGEDIGGYDDPMELD